MFNEQVFSKTYLWNPDSFEVPWLALDAYKFHANYCWILFFLINIVCLSVVRFNLNAWWVHSSSSSYSSVKFDFIYIISVNWRSNFTIELQIRIAKRLPQLVFRLLCLVVVPGEGFIIQSALIRRQNQTVLHAGAAILAATLGQQHFMAL